MSARSWLSIRQKLYVLGVVCLVGTSALATTAIVFSNRVAESARVIDQERFAPLSRVQDLSSQLKEVRFRLAGVLLDQMPIPGSRNQLADAVKAAPVLWGQFRTSAGTLEGRSAELAAAIEAELPQFQQFALTLDKAYASDDKAALQVLLEDEWPLVQQKIVKPLDAMMPSLSEEVARETAALGASARHFRDATAASAVLVLAVTLVIGALVIRSLVSGVGAAIGVAESLARGDLTQPPGERRGDELGQLLRALDVTVERLRGTIGDVRAGTGTIAITAREMSAGNADLSRRTEEQATSLEETASSLEELTSTVRRNAENARAARDVAVGAAGIAEQGGQVIAQVVQTMGSIGASSRRIVDITGVIDAIAFQTNILALNAAVEAARAGDQGRGFAVVAAEVRVLAQRSAASAKEIKELIAASVNEVQDGTRFVDAAGRTMADIVEAVQRVNGIIAEIAVASRQQAEGIAEVNLAMGQMDLVTQQNAALVEQASAAAESLNEQSQRLVRAVAVFRLEAKAPASAAELQRPAPGLVLIPA
jgi:methyl-accepting chemotaxis protein